MWTQMTHKQEECHVEMMAEIVVMYLKVKEH